MIIHKTFERLNITKTSERLMYVQVTSYVQRICYGICGRKINYLFFNPFHATGLFLYPLKTENQSLSDVFREYGKRPVASDNEA